MKTQNKKSVLTFGMISGLICFAAISRMLIPTLGFLPNNFAPMSSIALFGGAKYRRALALFLPLVVIWCSDLLIDYCYFGKFIWFYPGCYWQYLSYMVMAMGGYYFLQKTTTLRIFGCAISSSLLFFAISNFGVWTEGVWYPHTLSGLLHCYLAGIPFLPGTFWSDLFYSGILFGTYALFTKASTNGLELVPSFFRRVS
jgi:hypothetical protein